MFVAAARKSTSINPSCLGNTFDLWGSKSSGFAMVMWILGRRRQSWSLCRQLSRRGYRAGNPSWQAFWSAPTVIGMRPVRGKWSSPRVGSMGKDSSS
jgi:hypothetical protein